MNRFSLLCFLKPALLIFFLSLGCPLTSTCYAGELITFSGTFDPTIRPHDNTYNPARYADHRFSLPADGLVTMTVFFQPLNSQGEVEDLSGRIQRPVENCPGSWPDAHSPDGGMESGGEIYGPYPVEAGPYQFMLWSYYDPDDMLTTPRVTP